MDQESRWASVIYPLKQSKWGFCCLPPDRFKLAVNRKKEKQTAGSKWAKSQDFCYLPPDRVKLTVNTKKETNSRVKVSKESKWGKGQDGLLLLPPERVKMGCCCLPPDRVKLTVNSKKEANSRVKMG